MKRVFVAISLLLIACPSLAFAFGKKQMKDNRPDAAADLLAAFQGTCSSQGAATSAASAQTNLFITIVETLKSTQACQPYAAELTQIQNAATEMQSLQNSTAYQTYQTDQNELQVLTLALQSTSAADPEYAQLQGTIQTVRNQMYADEAAYNASQKSVQNQLIVSNSQSILNWGQQLASTTSSTTFDQCLAQSPLAAMQLSSNLIAYGGSFLPGLYGAAVSGIAQVFNIGASIFQNGQYDDAVMDAQADQMPDALNCALESMTDSYCNVDDSYSLVELARQNRNPDFTSLPLWRGIDLLGRQMPALTQWLQKIENGVAPQNTAEANQETSVITELLTVEEGNLSAVASINTAVEQYNEPGTAVAVKNNVLINGIASSALGMVSSGCPSGSSCSNNNIFANFQANPFVWACWLVNGYFPFNGYTAACPDPGTQYNPTGTPTITGLVGYVNMLTNGGATLPLVVPKLQENWNSINDQVETLAASDFARVIVTNPIDLISDAMEPSPGEPLSPRQVLGNLDSFIQGMIDYDFQGNAQLPTMLAMEKAKVDAAIQQLDGSDAQLCPPEMPAVVPAPPNSNHPGAGPQVDPSPTPSPSPTPVSPEECESRRLVKIFTIFGLENGPQVLTTEVQDLVDTDLENRFKSGEFPASKSDLLKTAGTDFYIRLSEEGLGDLDSITSDLNDARADYETNIRAFREFYEKAFEDALEHEAVLTQGEKESDGPNRPHGQKLAQLCMFWLFTGNIPGSQFGTDANWPSDRARQICESATYYNGNNNADANGVFTPAFRITDLEQQLGSASFADRICTYHRFKLHNEAEALYAGSQYKTQ